MSRRGSLRASDLDRDQVVDRLRRAATEGRIVSDELEHRVSAALKARTYDELDATVADLPGPRQSRRVPARRPPPQYALSAVRANPWLLLLAIPVLAVATAMLLAVTLLWTLVAVVALLAGGRPPRHRAGWTYSRRYVRSPRRGPGSYWA